MATHRAAKETQIVEISAAARERLREMAEQTGEPPEAILDHALEEYRRRLFLEGLNSDFAALRADPKAWADELKERADWDAVSHKAAD